MAGHRSWSDDQLVGDLLIGVPTCDQRGHLLLPRREHGPDWSDGPVRAIAALQCRIGYCQRRCNRLGQCQATPDLAGHGRLGFAQRAQSWRQGTVEPRLATRWEWSTSYLAQ